LQADAEYDTQLLRRKLRSRGVSPKNAINKQAKKIKKLSRPFSKPVDRWICERTFAWYQRKFRFLLVRWERKNTYWHGFLSFALCGVKNWNSWWDRFI